MELEAGGSDCLSTDAYSNSETDKDDSASIDGMHNSPSQITHDAGTGIESQELMDPTSGVTNFSISEILKPTFGKRIKSPCEHTSNKSDDVTDDVLDIVNDVEKTETTNRDYEQSHSLLFNFRCLKHIDIAMSSIIDNISMSRNKECVVNDNTAISSTNKHHNVVKPIAVHSNSQADNKRLKQTPNTPAELKENAQNKPIMTGTAVTSSLTMTSSVLVEPGQRRPSLWPAWVYCTRYSDRPSSGPRSRKVTRREKRPDEKRPRTAFTNEQLKRLKSEFETSRYLTEQRRKELARSLDLSEAQIKIWYQNKRAKIKKSSSGSMSSLAVHLMAQGLYNHKTYISETRRDC